MKKSYITIFIIGVIGIIGLGLTLGIKIYRDRNIIWAKENTLEDNNIISNSNTEIKKEEEKKEIKEANIFKGTDRPIAVMIDNHKGAWPQAGLNKAYLVYEIIAEGGETRLMALFKGQDLDVIGPVRSSRHYFLDYVMENDALYVHYGWSPNAKSDISSYGINNMNGIYYDKFFWRVKDKKAPHNAMISTKNIMKLADKLNYRTTSNITSVLKYSQSEIDLQDGISANRIYIPHSYMQNVTYKYNEETKRYTRYARGTLQKDYETNESFTTKNIIIMFADNSVLNDGTDKDRQDLYNIGTFDGYYITNGLALKIKCQKKDRMSKTIYKDLNGKEIEVNDGNTWINICPKKAKVSIK